MCVSVSATLSEPSPAGVSAAAGLGGFRSAD